MERDRRRGEEDVERWYLEKLKVVFLYSSEIVFGILVLILRGIKMEYSIFIIVSFILYGRSIWYLPSVDDVAHLKAREDWSKKKLTLTNIFRERLYGAGLFSNLKLDHCFRIWLFGSICYMVYSAFGSNTLSFITALLYLVHPANHQISLWLNGRRYALNCLLVCLIWTFKPLGILVYPLVPLLQINAILAPFLYLWEYPQFWYYWAIILILVLLILGKNLLRQAKGRFNSMPPGGVHVTFGFHKLIIMVKTIGYYLYRSIFPGEMTLYHGYLEMAGVDRKGTKDALRLGYDFWLSLFSIFLLTYCFLVFPTSRLGIVWFFIFIAPFSNAITLTQTFADRYLSLPLMGLLYAIVCVIAEFSYSTQLIGYTTLLVWNLRTTVQGMKMYKNLDIFYEYQAGTQPVNRVVRRNHFNRYFKNKMYLDAFGVVSKCVYLFPDDVRFLIHMASCCERLGLRADALKYCNKARGLLSQHECNTPESLGKILDKIECKVKEG